MVAQGQEGAESIAQFRYDFYEDKCERDVEGTVWSMMQRVIQPQHNAPAQLLRLLFHDCFIGKGRNFRAMEVKNLITDLGGGSARVLKMFDGEGSLRGLNIGKISCEFIRPRLSNFMGTGLPDPTLPSDFLEELKRNCPDSNSTISTSTNISMSLSKSAISDCPHFHRFELHLVITTLRL
ncbi:hypothetical protein RND71_007633 [Anisodus tanguticus]|uniref:peroxidase n=1 Tax=Anisodus tanguticus TaxID=243964 RepID=A0AAE1VT85_9SOLA|nr:hypothetical protein RND71_007633 [Anisodus tanguticus]